MSESSALREKRMELAELEQGAAYCDPALYRTMRQSLLDDLAELGALDMVPAAQARPNLSPIRLSSPRKPVVAAAQVVATPLNPEVLPALPVEKRMPRPFESPELKLDALMKRLAKAQEKGSRTCGISHAIREHCEAFGLPVPSAAQKVGQGRVKGGKAATESKPHRFSKAERRAIGKLLPSPDAMAAPYEALLGAQGQPAAARIRGLRSQALELLPILEDLSQEQIHAAEEQLDLLAKVLVLGGQIIRAQKVA